MRANLVLSRSSFVGNAPSPARIPDLAAMAAKVASVFGRLMRVLRPISFDEAYLNQSTSLADFERRQSELQRPRRSWY